MAGDTVGERRPSTWSVRRSGDEVPYPDPRQARRLVVFAGAFWFGWAVAAGGFALRAPALSVPGFVLCFPAGFAFYTTLYSTLTPLTGRPGWRLLLLPSFRHQRLRWKALLSLMRPKYIAATIRATAWPFAGVVLVLTSLLVLDLALFIAMMLTVPGIAPKR
jgi:hypothetical protein